MIIDPTYTSQATGLRTAFPDVIKELFNTGKAVPDITGITFNVGKKKTADGTSEYPVLATTIAFADNSKETVINSADDGLRLDENGRPTVFSKECGIVFCLAKRILAGKYVGTDDSLDYTSAGFGRILTSLVENAVDQNELKAKRNAERRVKAEAKQNAPSSKPKTKAPSLHDCVVDLSKNITELNEAISKLTACKA